MGEVIPKHEAIRRAERQFDIEQGIKIGKEEGREQGIEVGKYEMIIAMHQHGMSVDVIASIAKLSIDQIKAIIEAHRGNP